MSFSEAHSGDPRSPGRSASSPVPQPTPFSDYAGVHPAEAEITPAKTSPSTPRTPYGRRRKGPSLGMWAFLTSVAANVIAAIALLPMAPTLQAAMVKLSDQSHYTVLDVDFLTRQMTSPVTTAASWVGVIAFFLGVIALIVGRGRIMGLFAVLGCLFGPSVVMLFLVVVPTS